MIEEILGPQGVLAQHLPHYEHRPGQIAMAQAIQEVLAQSGQFLVEAGTGTGKTLAYLIPAIYSGQKVVVSTGTKNLQEQLYHKDIPFLAQHLGVKFKVCYMKGRNNYLCRRRWAGFAQQRMRPAFLTCFKSGHRTLIQVIAASWRNYRMIHPSGGTSAPKASCASTKNAPSLITVLSPA